MAWLTALSISWRLISETMSKAWSEGMVNLSEIAAVRSGRRVHRPVADKNVCPTERQREADKTSAPPRIQSRERLAAPRRGGNLDWRGERFIVARDLHWGMV